MKHKTNIPALLMALLVFIASNGIVLSEHICNTARSHDYSLFTEAKCEMEKQAVSCCAKKIIAKNNCCEHKQFFKKLPIEGFTAKLLQLKSSEKESYPKLYPVAYFNYSQQIFENYYSGLPPPDNLYKIKSLLQPSSIKLQIFRC